MIRVQAGTLAEAVKIIGPTLTAIGRGKDPWVVLNIGGTRVPVMDGSVAYFAGTFSKKDAPITLSPLGDVDEHTLMVAGLRMEWHTGKMELLPNAYLATPPVEFDVQELLRLAREEGKAKDKAERLAKQMLDADESLSGWKKDTDAIVAQKQRELCWKRACDLVSGCEHGDIGAVVSAQKSLRSAMKKLAKEHGIDYRQHNSKQLVVLRVSLLEAESELAQFTPEIVADLLTKQRRVDVLWRVAYYRQSTFVRWFPDLSAAVDDLHAVIGTKDWSERHDAGEERLREAIGGTPIEEKAVGNVVLRCIANLSGRGLEKLAPFQVELAQYARLAGWADTSWPGRQCGRVEELRDRLALRERIERAIDNIDLAMTRPAEFMLAVVDPGQQEVTEGGNA